MNLDGGGYNAHQYNNQELRKLAQVLAPALKDLLHKTGASHVVVTGKSGIALAFAAAMFEDFPICVVRKPEESSHGEDIEGSGCLGNYIILDDFVSSGATVDRVVSTLANRAEGKCLAVLEACGREFSDKCGVLPEGNFHDYMARSPYRGAYEIPLINYRSAL